MTARPFDITDSSSWPVVLTIEQVAAIYGLKVANLKHYLKPSSKTPFTPMPFMRNPARWRKCDVLRQVEGARASSHLQRVG